MADISHGKKPAYRFGSGELSAICGQFALILRSGIMMDDGLEAMCGVRGGAPRADAANKILLGMAEDMKRHSRLCDAAEKTGAFPRYMVGMIELGEKTGKLEDVMTALSHYYKREDHLRGMVLGAVLYPAALFVMLVAVIAVLVSKILPVFARVLEDMGAEPSPFVRAILYAGGPGSRWLLAALLLITAAAGVMFAYSRLRGRRNPLRAAFSSIPAVRRLSERMAAGQFASALAFTLSSGCNVGEALALIRSLMPNRRAAEKVAAVEAAIKEGKSLSQAVVDSAIFDGMPERMVVVGDRTGKVDDVMREIGALYDEETAVTLNNLAAVVEPAMVGVLALVTGVILLAVMLPLMGIISSIV